MAETLISTRLLEVISNRAAGNAENGGEPPFSDVQSHFRGHEGVPGRLDVTNPSLGNGRTLSEAPAIVFHPIERTPLCITRRIDQSLTGSLE